MSQRFASGKLVVASHNSGKVAEIAELLVPFSADIISASELDLLEPVEDGDSFAATASRTRSHVPPTDVRISRASWPWHGPPAILRHSRVRFTALWCGHRAANAGLATIRCSCPTGTISPSVSLSRRLSTPLVIGRRRLKSWLQPASPECGEAVA